MLPLTGNAERQCIDELSSVSIPTLPWLPVVQKQQADATFKKLVGVEQKSCQTCLLLECRNVAGQIAEVQAALQTAQAAAEAAAREKETAYQDEREAKQVPISCSAVFHEPLSKLSQDLQAV